MPNPKTIACFTMEIALDAAAPPCAVALNGSWFNTHRMLDQYIRKAYFA